MRSWSYNEYTPDGGIIVTKTEAELTIEYWPYWYKRMCDRFGKHHVDLNYTLEDCIDDWVVVNWAWPNHAST